MIPTSVLQALGCTPDAAFWADVTVPDNTRIEIGESFVKTWRIHNTGTCEWTQDFLFTFADGRRMGGPIAVSVDETGPEESVDVSVELVAPATPGIHRGDWQMCVGGEYFGKKVYVQIVAYDPSAPEPTAATILEERAVEVPLPEPEPVSSCAGNVYDCAYFSSHWEAQACFEYCISVGRGDIHHLDDDSDGVACEAPR